MSSPPEETKHDAESRDTSNPAPLEVTHDATPDNIQDNIENRGCCGSIISCCSCNTDTSSDSNCNTDHFNQSDLFDKLEISMESQLQHTEDHIAHLILSIIFSPIVWLWIPLIGPSPTFIIATLMTTIGMFILGVMFWSNLKSQKSPFGLAAGGYLSMTFIAQFILNVSILIEISRVYFNSDINVVYHCYYEHFDDNTVDPPNFCMIYLDILGSAYVAFLSSIYINVACIRTTKINKETQKTPYEIGDGYDEEMKNILGKYAKKKESILDKYQKKKENILEKYEINKQAENVDINEIISDLEAVDIDINEIKKLNRI